MHITDLLFRRMRRANSRSNEDPFTLEFINIVKRVNSAKPTFYRDPLSQTQFICVDLEFSNLRSKKGDILSIGWVEIENCKLRLNTSKHLYVRNRSTVGQSAAIHHILDCEAKDGHPLKRALFNLLQHCEGKVFIFHHAKLDLEYLQRACKSICGEKLDLAIVDTMAQEQKQLLKSKGAIAPGDLTLKACRTRHNLPNYPEHNALVDAIATGELFLAQTKRTR